MAPDSNSNSGARTDPDPGSDPGPESGSDSGFDFDARRFSRFLVVMLALDFVVLFGVGFALPPGGARRAGFGVGLVLAPLIAYWIVYRRPAGESEADVAERGGPGME